MSEATRRRLEATAPPKKKNQSSRLTTSNRAPEEQVAEMNTAECRAQRRAEEAKLIHQAHAQDADRLVEENVGKIAELNAKVAEAEKTAVEAEEARVAAEAARAKVEKAHAAELSEAKAKAIAEYRDSEQFVALVDKEVMDQCDDFLYRVKWYNPGQKLKLNFLLDPHQCSKG